jgi:RND superfamily putative drug exporter
MRARRTITGITYAAVRAPRRTLALAAVALVLAGVVGAPVTSSLQPFSSEDPSSESVAARHAIEQATGIDPYFNLIALVFTPSGIASHSARTEIARVEGILRKDPTVATVASYYHDRTGAMVSSNGRSTFVVGSLRAKPIQSQLAGARRVERQLSALPGVKLGGLAAFYAQGNDTAREDLITAELLAFPLLLLITLWVFRGVVAAMLPLLIGAVTIVGTFAILRLASEVTNVSIYALNIATALGLGLAVDYSLLIISRYREETALNGPGSVALRRTLSSAGRTVAISALTVAGVMSCLLVFAQPFLKSIGLGGILVAVLAGASALTILPAILSLLRWHINSLSPESWRRAAYRSAQPSSSGVWYRISRLVMRRPWWIALISVAALLSLSSPVLGLRVTQVDANDVPRSSSSRQVYNAIQQDYPLIDNSPIFLAVQAPVSTTSKAPLEQYVRQLQKLPHVAAVEGPSRLDARMWQINVVPATAPLSPASQSLVANIRALRSSDHVLVGGESASLVDLKSSLGSDLPYALAILVMVTAFAVFLMTGSVVLPIKAVLISTLTITATFGAMVLVFQNGALEGVLDYTSSHALEASTLVLIFAMSFGLATDYGIFLFSRIREMRDQGAGDVEAVALGLERTGRIVTAAALILCIALASLMTAHHALVKEVGFGAALAVAIDVTAVRAMLLPALMRILGRRNWWSPFRFEGFAEAPGPPSAPQATTGRAPSASPSERVCAPPSGLLAATRYCDRDDPIIRHVVAELATDGRADEDLAIATAAFEFVRDNILYTFGPWGMSASQTLQRRRGMCTNKANLLVAMLRCAGIPAAYGVLRVNAREYFGAVGPAFLTRYTSPESTHVYAAAFLNGRWVKCDPSTDRELASRTAHFCQQTRLIEWDGARDSMDFLDPKHIYADLGLYADIDELLEKPARGSLSERWAIFNDYLQFIRAQPAFACSGDLITAYRSSRTTAGWLRYVLRRAT